MTEHTPQHAAGLVLVVDDHPDEREMMAALLRAHGYDVTGASSGIEAYDKAARYQPRAVVLDLALPGFDGLDAVRAIRADPRTSSIPVVAITAAVHSYSEYAARAVGCTDFLVKPCPPELLLAAVGRAGR